jgi:hypothetical protein
MAEEGSNLVPSTGDEASQRLVRLLDGHVAAQVAHVVALLGVPDHLADGPRSARDLASATSSMPGPLARLLAAASMYGLVSQDGQGNFALTAMGALLRTGVDGSMRSRAAGFLTPPIWQAWGQLAEIVQTGRSPVENTWAYFEQHPADAAWFARAMGEVTAAVVSRMAVTGYAPPPAERIVDVGGSRGTLLAGLLRSAPAARGVVFDRAEALTEAETVLAEAGVADRAEAIAGDFFAEVPAGDLHVLSNVLHDWEDDQARRIVARCHQASRPGGGLLVIGMLLPSPPRPSPAGIMDLRMMVVVESGRERTLDELRSLMAAEGYAFARHVSLGDELPWHVVEFLRT